MKIFLHKLWNDHILVFIATLHLILIYYFNWHTEKLTNELSKEFEDKLKVKDTGTGCVLFDGRMGETKTMMEIEGSDT